MVLPSRGSSGLRCFDLEGTRYSARLPVNLRITVQCEGDLDDAFNRWAGNVNLEERVDGVEEIDPVVLEELRELS